MITPQQLEKIVDHIDKNGLNESVLSSLRTVYPGCHFTWCMDDDINFSKPWAKRETFNVYLVDSRDHCSTLTDDAGVASGVVLAELVQ